MLSKIVHVQKLFICMLEQKPIGNKHLLHKCVVCVCTKLKTHFVDGKENGIGRKVLQFLVWSMCTCNGSVYEAKLRNLNDCDINTVLAYVWVCASSSWMHVNDKGTRFTKNFSSKAGKSSVFGFKYVIIRIISE